MIFKFFLTLILISTIAFPEQSLSLEHECSSEDTGLLNSDFSNLSPAVKSTLETDISELNDRFHFLINEERRKEAEKNEKYSCQTKDWKLERKADLDAIAKWQCEFMASKVNMQPCNSLVPKAPDYSTKYRECIQANIRKAMKHTDDENKNEADRAKAAGVCKVAKFQVCDISANISASFTPVVDLEIIPRFVDGYMNSPGHKRNILAPFSNETGVAVCVTAGNFVFTSQVFAERRLKGDKSASYKPIPGCVPEKKPGTTYEVIEF